jgi:outer membrane protein assembly factor BamB
VFQRALPPLTLRTDVSVVLAHGGVFAGFPGGRLIALSLQNGNVGWEAAVALPKGANELERIADVASVPVLDNRQCCAVAYQGRAACFDLMKGTQLWAQNVSSVAGLTMDGRSVYVAEERSAVIAFDRFTGGSLWKQDKLFGRQVSAPAVLGRHVAVGDYQGYVHFLAQDDGSFAARIATDGSAIVARPLAVGNRVLVQTRNGGVYLIGMQ